MCATSCRWPIHRIRGFRRLESFICRAVRKGEGARARHERNKKKEEKRLTRRRRRKRRGGGIGTTRRSKRRDVPSEPTSPHRDSRGRNVATQGYPGSLREISLSPFLVVRSSKRRGSVDDDVYASEATRERIKQRDLLSTPSCITLAQSRESLYPWFGFFTPFYSSTHLPAHATPPVLRRRRVSSRRHPL